MTDLPPSTDSSAKMMNNGMEYCAHLPTSRDDLLAMVYDKRHPKAPGKCPSNTRECQGVYDAKPVLIHSDNLVTGTDRSKSCTSI